ncbi:hypothetical protein WM40_20420 [Robbsia andropogonis]|uniref:Glycosyl transferase family 1 domain-containing protein n=1 Tax=Robbsia andropogonis TaxID=28092 RepID=A0A0F5JVQ4_9BURK|nr:glycosyltransferase [Robbsia andropogonis]KKB61946.1 hypothetical protein WM40_20420 [Robbsia andropogonis]
MKIAHILSGFPVEYAGGITNYVRTLISSQIDDGHEIVLVSALGANSKIDPRIEFIAVSCERPADFSHVVSACSEQFDGIYSNLVQAGVDIVHFHTIFGFSEKSLNDFSSGTLPYVVSLHDYYIGCPRVFMMDKWGGICHSIDVEKCVKCCGVLDNVLLYRRVARKMKFVLPAISDNKIRHRKDIMARFTGSAARLLPVSGRVSEIYAGVYPNGCYSVVHIGNESANAVVLPKIEAEKIQVTFLGTFNRHKGADLYIELAVFCTARNRNMEFGFYGKLEANYEKLIEESPIKFHGKYRPSDIPAILSKSDIGVALPIWEDNGPQVVMEMINHTTPVLATRRGGIPDFVPAGGGILFNPSDDREKIAAFERISKLTREDISEMRSKLVKLKTPAMHGKEINEVYSVVINEKND